uniref:Uncharacterized protein n=1 Tax=Arundo donax TaxID=35708 RepID=A0A0A8YQB8_ARUDO
MQRIHTASVSTVLLYSFTQKSTSTRGKRKLCSKSFN